MQQQHSSSCTQGTKQRKENVHTGDTTTLVDVLMPRDDTLYAEDAAMEETDYELEEYKQFCFMNKPLEKYLKVIVKEPAQKKTLL